MNEFHPVVLGTETTDLETSAYQDLTDGVKFGIPSALASGVISMYNSTVGSLGGDKIDVQEQITKYSEQAGDYYAEHKQGVDMVGMVATSLIPGTLAMKGVQLLRAGNAVGSFGRALGFASSRKEQYLKAAIQEIGSTGGVVAKLGTANGLKYAAWETADQALLAGAFELGVLATMHDSPVFSTDTYADFAKNMAIGVVFGGVTGGAISTLMGRGILKGAAATVQEQSRKIDTIFDADKLALSKGTQTYALAKEIAALPEVAQDIPFNFKLDGVEQQVSIKTGDALQKAKDRAVKTAQNKLAVQFTELANGDATFGQAYYDLIQRGMEAANVVGKTGTEAVDVIHGYLQNVAKVGHIDLDRYALDRSKFYIDSAPKGDTLFAKLKSTFTPERSATTSKQAYRLTDDATMYNIKMADFSSLGAKDLKDAFRANPGIDLVRLDNGKLAVNPLSENIKRVSDTPYVVRKYVHLETGAVSSETIATFPDIVAKGDIRVTDTSISAGSVRSFSQPASIATRDIPSPMEASARWAWAAKMEWPQLLRVSKGVVDSEDLPMMAQLAKVSKGMSPEALGAIKIKEGNVLTPAYEYVNFDEAVHGSRRTFLKGVLDNAAKNTEAAVPSTQHWAAYTGTNIEYVESMIAGNFKLANMPAEVLASNVDTTANLVPKSLMVEWNFGVAKALLPEEAYNLNMGPNHLAAKELTAAYQILINQDIGTKAQEIALGEHMSVFRPAPDVKTGNVDAQGAGASTFGASNADYTKAAQLWVQDTGKAVALTTQRVRDAAIEALAPAINAIRGDQRAAAELGAITTALRKTPLRFRIVDDLVDNQPAKRLVSREVDKLYKTGKFDNLDEAIDFAKSQDGLVHAYPINSKAVVDFLENTTAQNDIRLSKMTALHNAAGLNTHTNLPGEIYIPPVNTQRYPYFAIVKPKKMVGLGSDVSMITARSEAELRKYADAIADKFDVHFKADTDAYYKARGEYDYQMTVNEGAINAELHRAGILGDVMPETRAENVLTDWLEHTAKQEERLVRTAVQVGNRQFFSELSFLSESYRTIAESQARGLGAKLKSKIADPFQDYIKTALNISKQGEFPLLDSLNDFVDKLGFKAGEAIAAARSQAVNGYLPWDQAAKVMKEYGLGQGLDEKLYHIANGTYPSNLIKDVLAKGNMWLATTTLRLDFINPLINMISTPIMIGTEVSALKRLIGGDTELAANFRAAMSVAGPDGRSMPSTVNLIAKGINNFFGAEKQMHLDRYKRIGAIKDVSQLYHETLDDLSYTSGAFTSKATERMNAAIERGAKITGNTFAEDFTRFISADVMRQISDTLVTAGKLTAKEQDSFISTFVNKVQGNYVTSQRPIIFQGTTGAAVSLFQTYAFNVLQQLTRHVENGDKRTLMLFAGLQSSLFGLNGLPFFEALNTHLVGSWLANNPQHNDSYNILPKFNKELGDWALYGSASAFPLFSSKAPALFSRGDINPRYLTILPNSFVDIPVVQASLKLFDAVSGFAGNIGRGTDVKQAALQALEHQGWNRPLAGFAQALSGQATTSKGALISSASEMETTSKLMFLQDRLIDFGGAARMLGARPMDESIALNNLYRNKSYDALDKERIDRLGVVVKSKLYGNQAPTEEEMADFMVKYTRSGGRIENFQQSLQRWSRDANVSVINQTLARANTPSAAKLKMIMGGEGIEDYATRTVEAPEE